MSNTVCIILIICIIHWDLGWTYYKMTVSERIKIIDNKVEQNKAQYNLDRQTAKMPALSSRNVGKYEFLAGEDVSPEKYLLEKAAAIKRFEYSPLGREFKKHKGIIKNK